MIEDHDAGIAWQGVRGPLRLADVLFVARKSNRIAPLQAVRASIVCGPEHLASAALHAHRAQREGRMQAKSLEVEFTRYLAGQRQIRDALTTAGVRDGEDAAVIVGLGPKGADAVQHFTHALGLILDDTVAQPGPDKLEALGVTKPMLEATTPERRNDIALELVALVDLMRN